MPVISVECPLSMRRCRRAWRRTMLLLDDGKLRLRVDDVNDTEVDCTVLIGGRLSSRKGVNKLGGGLAAPALTEKDLDDIRAMPDIQPDFVAVSFVSSAEDIAYARQLLANQGLNPPSLRRLNARKWWPIQNC